MHLKNQPTWIREGRQTCDPTRTKIMRQLCDNMQKLCDIFLVYGRDLKNPVGEKNTHFNFLHYLNINTSTWANSQRQWPGTCNIFHRYITIHGAEKQLNHLIYKKKNTAKTRHAKNYWDQVKRQAKTHIQNLRLISFVFNEHVYTNVSRGKIQRFFSFLFFGCIFLSFRFRRKINRRKCKETCFYVSKLCENSEIMRKFCDEVAFEKKKIKKSNFEKFMWYFAN